jgi:hypothetical protein
MNPILQSGAINFVLTSDLSDRNRAIVGMVIVYSIRKTLLAFSSGNSHNKRCVLLVITIENVSTVVDVGIGVDENSGSIRVPHSTRMNSLTRQGQ